MPTSPARDDVSPTGSPLRDDGLAASTSCVPADGAAGWAETTKSESAGDPTPPKSKPKQFVWTVGFAFAIVGLQVGQGVLLARLLGPEGRGGYAASVLYVQLLLYVGLFGGLEVVCRYAARPVSSPSGGHASLRRAALWLGITTGLITTAVAIVLNVLALPEEKRSLLPIAILCSLSLVGQHVMLIMTAVDRGSGEFGKYNLHRMIAASAFPLVLLLAAMVTTVDVTIAGGLFVLASLISMASCLVGLPRPFRGPSEPSTRQLLKESRPYGVSMLATDLFERLDLLLVLWLAPLIEQGFYAAMVPAVYPLTVIPNTLGLFLFNAGADSKRAFQRRDVHRVLGSSFAVQAASTIVFMLLIGPLVVMLYGNDFRPAIVFALWLAPVSAIKGILQGLDAYLKGRGRPLVVVRARMAGMLVMLVSTALLFAKFQTVAVAMGALAGQLVCLTWLIVIIYSDIGKTDEPIDPTPQTDS